MVVAPAVGSVTVVVRVTEAPFEAASTTRTAKSPGTSTFTDTFTTTASNCPLKFASTVSTVTDPSNASVGSTTSKTAALWRATATPSGVAPDSRPSASKRPAAAGTKAPE